MRKRLLGGLYYRHDHGHLVCLHRGAAGGPPARPLGDLVATLELEPVVEDYTRFLADFQDLTDILDADPSRLTPEPAFMVRERMMYAFRRINLRDPQLPLSLLLHNGHGTCV